MKTLRIKAVPRAGSYIKQVNWLSCPSVDPEAQIKRMQALADAKHVAVIYTQATDLEYFANRGAREWLMSEPGDTLADDAFKAALVSAGVLGSNTDVCVICCTGVDDTSVMITTVNKCYLIRTDSGAVVVQE